MASDKALKTDAVVVGAGFAGLYMLQRLRELGLASVGVEAADDVGGTWYWNRYPGARCDVESLAYSFTFSDEIAQGWNWSERYAAQPEILAYIKYVADKLDLRRDILFGRTVSAATWDDKSGRWLVELDNGVQIDAQYCIMATGCLSRGRVPDIPGLDSFEGEWHHTGTWPKEPVDLAGKSVAVIGTGSTGIQLIPAIAEEVGHLTVFQRTPSFSVPARNRPMDPDFEQRYLRERDDFVRSLKAGEIFGGGDLELPAEERQPAAAKAFDVSEEERTEAYWKQWNQGGSKFMHCFPDQMLDQESNDAASDFVRARIAETVDDPEIAEVLMPRGYPIGSKRVCLDTDYYQTYNRENVDLVNALKEPITAIEPNGIRTTDGFYPLDVILFATGFDAMTGALTCINMKGRNGIELKDHWAGGPATNLGIAVSGFPNMFLVTGPGSPSVLSNVVLSIEQHIEWIADCLAYMQEHGYSRVETEAEAEREWVQHVNDLADATLFPVANSWYVGANVPGKPRVFMAYVGGVPAFRQACDEVVEAGYRGFRMERAEAEQAPAQAQPGLH